MVFDFWSRDHSLKAYAENCGPAERVNELAPSLVMNLLSKSLVFGFRFCPLVAG